MKTKLNKILSLVLVLCVLISTFSATLTVYAQDTSAVAETPTVEIVSFMRGSQKDLRSSELLEARLTGYTGNARELTYKWESTLGTYLYVYNSHNMYYIEGADGEIEIYNSKIAASNNMAGRTYKDSFTGEGYCWAAIYGSNTSGTGTNISDQNAYNGTIKVTVYDKEGNAIATDSHTGTVTTSGFWLWQTTTYSGIVDHSLQSDMDNVTIGLFEGDERNVKDLLGESAIIHITCVESNVSQGIIVSGDSNISLRQDGDYYIKGVKAGTSTDANGDAKVQLTVSKNTCKFHEESSGTATTTVYVFKKPTTSTTAYTLSLTGNLDSRCRYFIYGREGVKQDDGTILFDGLTPNTEYPVEVRAEYKDENNNTRYTYAYVYDTTEPIYNGTVEVYLNGTYDSATHTAQGTKVNLEDVTSYSTLYAKEVNGTEFIKLNKVEGTVGTYTNILDEGSYMLYYEKDESTKIDDQLLTMHNADRTRYLFYNSVTYVDGGVQLSTDDHVTGSAVDVWDEIPQKEGYVFTGWKDQNGNTYKSTDELTPNIGEPYVLEAQWEEGTDVYVNITINHTADNGSLNNDKAMHNVAYDLMTKPLNSNNYEDVLTNDIKWDGESEFNFDGYSVDYSDNKTVYTATKAVAHNVLASSDYIVEIAKTGYELLSVNTTKDENGNIIIDAQLQFAPSNHDFKFSVELDEDSKKLPKEFLPVAVHAKVTCWYDSPYIDGEGVDWATITQHQDAFITVALDENGSGEGSYPVWATTTDGAQYHYRIEVVSYLLQDGTVLPAVDSTLRESSHVTQKYTEYCTDNERYHAKIVVTDGKTPDTATTLTGAYFNDNAQQGQVKAVVSIKTHTVTFEPDGGKFADNTIDNKIVEKQLIVPNLADYTVTRDGGYVFDGWHVVENGEVTNKTVNSYDELFDDIILRAKWIDPLTVEGKIFVAGYYHLNDDVNDIRKIPEHDRTHSVTIFLQKLLPNGYAETVLSQKVDVTYDDADGKVVEKPMGTASYKFDKVPNDGHSYRVLLSNPNYIVTYQNEDDSLDENKISDFTTYNNLDFIADFGSTEPTVADVNAFMEFEPHEFDLHYQVKATTIGEGFRPSTTEILVLCDDGKSGNRPQDWPIITQMYDGETKEGQDTALNADGIGDDSFKAWRNKTDGHSLYDYGVLLHNYTINGVETAYNAESAPFFVYYNGSARYSALEGLNPAHQTQLLTVDLQPKRYNVIFDMNYTETEEDHVENMDDYLVFVNGVPKYLTGHLWSYETDVSNVTPTREGYKFLGWYDENDAPVESIGADVHQDVTLYAKWEKVFKVTFHANNDDIGYDVFRTYYENGANISDENAYFLNADGTLDSFYDIPEFEYLTHNNYVFKGWYDENGNPINYKEKYTEDTDLYAQWIKVENVDKDEADTKLYDNSGKYPGYDLLGVQVRDIEKESADHYGEAGTGLRFVTVLSNDVYKQINALSTKNASGAEYGYVIAKTATAKKYAGDTKDYELQYKDANVNGKDTTTAYKYVQNSKCSGVTDHFGDDNTAYRLYTTVVTYKGLEGDALSQAHSQQLLARSYIRYTDANGLLRTHYNNYTGTNTYSGCSASFDLALSLMNR